MGDKLKALGFWVGVQNSTVPHPKHSIGHYHDAAFKQNPVTYLNSGAECAVWRGFSYCRFHCDVVDESLVALGYGQKAYLTMYQYITSSCHNFFSIMPCLMTGQEANSKKQTIFLEMTTLIFG